MCVKFIRLIFAVAVFVNLSGPAAAQEHSGRVVGVTDGDTLTLLTSAKARIKVRLAQIDTPEKRQPYGSRAKQALSQLAFGKHATVRVEDHDRYGRVVGRVYVDGVDINAALVAQGAAWVYRRYASDPKLFRLEDAARKQRVGLWALPAHERVPPWEWRRGGRSPARRAPASAASSGGNLRCGEKTRCSQMTSCAEAKFYQYQCGVRTLDGDRDGVPCEQLCR